MDRIAVIDFETTGLSPAMGDRATEVAIVMLEEGRVVDRFQSLMNAGVHIPAFVTQLTGISNDMLATAPPAAAVMLQACRFVGDAPMVAHNASFDRKFWSVELALAGLLAPQLFACTLLLSRRLYPQLPSHKLGSLIRHHRLPQTGVAHRAMADAEMAAHLLEHMRSDLRIRHKIAQPDHALLMGLQRCAKAAVSKFIARQLLPDSSPQRPAGGHSESFSA